MHGCMDGRLAGWMDGRMDAWLDGWMDGYGWIWMEQALSPKPLMFFSRQPKPLTRKIWTLNLRAPNTLPVVPLVDPLLAKQSCIIGS